MYARWEDEGVKAPKVVGRATPTKVADVVLSCIKKNRGEVLVNTPPVRPIAVLFNIAPRLMPGAMKLLGYTKTFERTADIASKS
jgi:hypothetical protein